MPRSTAADRLAQRPLLARAVALLQAGDAARAEAALAAVLQRWPGQGDALHFMGLLRHQQGQSQAALALLQQAAAALPQEPGPCNNLGNVLMALQRWPQAEQAYRQALARAPDFADALGNLAQVCLQQGRLDEAAAHFGRALLLQPGHAIWQHQLAACDLAHPPARASNAYLQQVFDAAAAGFDQHLTALQYRAPELMAAQLRLHCGAPAGQLDVADLGCGTGLCAPHIKPWARHLSGCDLSAGMLAQAQGLGLYDTLVQAELTDFLLAHPGAFDVLVCADTFIYIGALHGVALAAAAALRPGGCMVFSAETLPVTAPHALQLRTSGRYAHRADHIQAAFAQAGLRLAPLATQVLRLEAGQGVEGVVGLAAKPTR